jgi:hypothetical protein
MTNPIRAEAVERAAKAIYQAQYPTGTSWEDWAGHMAKNPDSFDGRDESRRLARAALEAGSGDGGRVRELEEALESAAVGFSKLSRAFGKHIDNEPMQELANMCAASAGECRTALSRSDGMGGCDRATASECPNQTPSPSSSSSA